MFQLRKLFDECCRIKSTAYAICFLPIFGSNCRLHSKLSTNAQKPYFSFFNVDRKQSKYIQNDFTQLSWINGACELVHCFTNDSLSRRDSNQLHFHSIHLNISTFHTSRAVQVLNNNCIYIAHLNRVCSSLDALTALFCMGGILLVVQPPFLFGDSSTGIPLHAALITIFGSCCSSLAMITIRLIGPGEDPNVLGEPA